MGKHHMVRAWQDKQHIYPKNSQGVGDMINFYSRLYLDTTLEQCTGEKYIDGNLIYEGDIVKAHRFYFDGLNCGNDQDIVGQIVWNNNAEAEWIILTKDGFYSFSETSHFEEPCIEKLGNIHENPDLLA